ncbi:ionotropic receptor 21a-like [Battus philenor]|uniref:ionotropic receptor 21a-like n=1 Tax=Battus philenor TaxID=42288 RepID=UPI0035D017D9
MKTVLLYGREMWKVIKDISRRRPIFVNNCLRCVLGIYWHEKVADVDLWKRCGEMPIDQHIKYRNWNWIGHTLRWDQDHTPRAATASYYSSCIIQLMNIYFDKPGYLVFASSYNGTRTTESIRSDLLSHINGNKYFSVQVTSPLNVTTVCSFDNERIDVIHTNPYFEYKGDYYIAIAESYTEFTYLAKVITQTPSWNAKAKFIVVLFNFAGSSKLAMLGVEKIMDHLFNFNAINVIILSPQPENVRKIPIYAWKLNEYSKACGFLSQNSTNMYMIKNVCSLGVIENDTDMFTNKIPSSLEGCNLHILALERQPFISENENDPNIEKLYINEMASKHKLQTKYSILKMSRGERNPYWNGALKELSLQKGHVLLGGIFPDYDVHEDFESSTTYLGDSYAWVVPRASSSPRWLALIHIFQKYVWFSTIATFGLCVLAWRILGQLSGDSYYHINIFHCLLNTYVSGLGFPAYVRPVKNSLRVFFAFFSIFCLIFVTAFQAKLIAMLRHVTFQNQIKSVEDLIDSGLKFGGPEELHDLFDNSSGVVDTQIEKEWINVENVAKALVDVTVHRNFSVLCSRLELSYLSSVMPELRDNLGHHKFFVFKQNTFTVPIEMIARKGFPIMERISHTFNLLNQIGLSEILHKKLYFFNQQKKALVILPSKIHKSNVAALSTKDLQGGFFVLALGVTFGVVVFVIEIIIDIIFVKNTHY